MVVVVVQQKVVRNYNRTRTRTDANTRCRSVFPNTPQEWPGRGDPADDPEYITPWEVQPSLIPPSYPEFTPPLDPDYAPFEEVPVARGFFFTLLFPKVH
jgi:hypothetical protein